MTKNHLSTSTWLALGAAVALHGVQAGVETGPSSSQTPYILPVGPNVGMVSILTVGDSVNMKADGITPYRLAGLPDGMGAFPNGDRTFTLLVNHEMGNNSGAVHEHGFRGAFVSKWIINKDTLEVLHGEDLIKRAWRWDTNSLSYQPITNSFGRFCAGDLPPPSGFSNGKKGFNGYIYMNGEETGAEGRAFAHFMDGNSYELPHLGKFSWENSVAHPKAGDKTIVAGLDDSGNGQVYFYVGDKIKSTDPLLASGLFGGNLYGLKVEGFPFEIAATGIPVSTPFSLVNLGDVSAKTGAQLETQSNLALVSRFNRPEDGSWHPNNPHDFYFVTTASFNGNSRLWRLRFHNINDPAGGGMIDMVLDGSEGQKMMDNMTINKRGSIFIQEDPGNQAYLAKIHRYSIALDTLQPVAEHDPSRFLVGGANFMTQDEETSGIIPLDNVGRPAWYMINVQAHYNIGDPELVEGGQILMMHFNPNREQ